MSFNSDTLIVEFTDGHTGVWRSNIGGWSMPTAIDFFRLTDGTKTVVLYHSPYQYPRNTDGRNGFVQVAPGYTLARIVEYWEVADATVGPGISGQGDAWAMARIMSDCRKDLADIREGRCPLPTA